MKPFSDMCWFDLSDNAITIQSFGHFSVHVSQASFRHTCECNEACVICYL